MGKKSKEKPAQSVTSTGPPEEFMPNFRELIAGAGRAFNNDKDRQAPRNTVQGFDPLQTTAQNSLVQMAQGPLRQFSDLLLKTAGTNLTDFLRPDNPMVQGAADAAVAPLLRAFERTIMPGLQGEAIKAGGMGGSRQGVAQANASDLLMQNVGEVSQRTTLDAFSTGLDQMMKTLALGPQTQAAGIFPELAMAGVGEQRQAQGQRERDANTAATLFDQNRESTALANYANILFGLPMGSSTAQQTAARGESGGAGATIGAGLQGASLGFKVGGPWGAAVGGGLGILSSIF